MKKPRNGSAVAVITNRKGCANYCVAGYIRLIMW